MKHLARVENGKLIYEDGEDPLIIQMRILNKQLKYMLESYKQAKELMEIQMTSSTKLVEVSDTIKKSYEILETTKGEKELIK